MACRLVGTKPSLELMLEYCQINPDNFNDILMEIHKFLFKKMHFKISLTKWWPFGLGLNMFNPRDNTASTG